MSDTARRVGRLEDDVQQLRKNVGEVEIRATFLEKGQESIKKDVRKSHDQSVRNKVILDEIKTDLAPIATIAAVVVMIFKTRKRIATALIVTVIALSGAGGYAVSSILGNGISAAAFEKITARISSERTQDDGIIR